MLRTHVGVEITVDRVLESRVRNVKIYTALVKYINLNIIWYSGNFYMHINF